MMTSRPLTAHPPPRLHIFEQDGSWHWGITVPRGPCSGFKVIAYSEAGFDCEAAAQHDGDRALDRLAEAVDAAFVPTPPDDYVTIQERPSGLPSIRPPSDCPPLQQEQRSAAYPHAVGSASIATQRKRYAMCRLRVAIQRLLDANSAGERTMATRWANAWSGAIGTRTLTDWSQAEISPYESTAHDASPPI